MWEKRVAMARRARAGKGYSSHSIEKEAATDAKPGGSL